MIAAALLGAIVGMLAMAGFYEYELARLAASTQTRNVVNLRLTSNRPSGTEG